MEQIFPVLPIPKELYEAIDHEIIRQTESEHHCILSPVEYKAQKGE